MSNLEQLSEHELIRRIRSGDEQALTEMYMRHSRPLFVYASKFVNDDDATDAVHDVFLNMLIKIRENSFDVHTSLSALLYQSVKNTVLRKIERSKASVKIYDAIGKRLTSGELTTERDVLERETRRNIEAELEQLPPVTRQVFISFNQEHRSQKEIAHEMGLSLRSVKRHVSHAVKALQTKLTSILPFL